MRKTDTRRERREHMCNLWAIVMPVVQTDAQAVARLASAALATVTAGPRCTSPWQFRGTSGERE